MEDDIKKTVPNHKVLYVIVPVICAIILVVSAVILGYIMSCLNVMAGKA